MDIESKKAKRKPTEYRIFIRPPGTQQASIIEVGTIVAFTPQQARRKAAASNEIISTYAKRQKSGEVTILAIPVSSMKPSIVKISQVARVEEPEHV